MESNRANKSDSGEEVCVIGAGVLGLVATKNLVEQGLTVKAFEKNAYAGGIWHVSQDLETISALQGTRLMSSKYGSAFTDFPMANEFPLYPSANEFESYLLSYAKNFDLLRHFQFSTIVTCIKRNEDDSGWIVRTEDVKTGETSEHRFNRVVVATGFYNTKNQPSVSGIDKFTGEVIHSQEFKDPSKYAGKNVLVVGMGPSGADTLCFLKKAGAGKLYVSHRGPYYSLPRLIQGRSHDQHTTRRSMNIFRYIATISTWLAGFLAGILIQDAGNTNGPKADSYLSLLTLKPKDRFLLHRDYFISDDLPGYLEKGDIGDLPGITQVTGPHSVAFTDGSEITNIDAIIFCTGYSQHLSIIQGPGYPSDPALAYDGFQKWNKSKYHKPKQSYPRLYRGFMSERYPESLAVLGHLVILIPSACVTYDLVTMALASLWSGKYPYPSKKAIKKEIDSHYDVVVGMLERGPLPYLGFRVNDKSVYNWLNKVAGTGVVETLDNSGRKNWQFWWKNRKLHNLLMDGPDLPAVYRLFDTGKGRKPWKNAAEVIEQFNKETKVMGDSWKAEQKELSSANAKATAI